jgi:carbonic anhydrase
MSTVQQQPQVLAEGLEIKNLRVVDENYSPEPAGDGDGVIDKFKEGFKTFKIEKYLAEPEKYKKLAEAQEPKVLIITCIDSRVDPAILYGLDIGESFVLRNVANFVHPYQPGQEGHDHGPSSATLFAVTVIKIQHIVVAGHSGCGGINALFARDDFTTDSIGTWIKAALPAKEKALAVLGHKSQEEQKSFAEKEAVNISLRNLLTYPYIAERVKDGRLQLHGFHYDLSGKLTTWDVERT